MFYDLVLTPVIQQIILSIIVFCISTAKLIKTPYFFLVVGSQAIVGGSASAPIVAQAFHPSLATVGVLLAVVGYAIGTIGAIVCTILLELASKA